MNLSLVGKVALVTGGSCGIVAAICKMLGSQGAQVAIDYASSLDAAQQLVNQIEVQGGRQLPSKLT